MCNPAPVAQACWRDAQKFAPGVYYLGICGDFAHSQRRSGDNCGAAPGGQELPINGVGYDTRHCHALDIGHGGNRELAAKIRNALLADPRVRYVLDNGTGYYPPHRGGGTFTSFDHTEHVHVSFMPGTTFDVRPFFTGQVTPTPPQTGGWLMAGEKEEIQRDIRLAAGLILADSKERQDQTNDLIRRKAAASRRRDEALAAAIGELGGDVNKILAAFGPDTDGDDIQAKPVPSEAEIKAHLEAAAGG